MRRRRCTLGFAPVIIAFPVVRDRALAVDPVVGPAVEGTDVGAAGLLRGAASAIEEPEDRLHFLAGGVLVAVNTAAAAEHPDPVAIGLDVETVFAPAQRAGAVPFSGPTLHETWDSCQEGVNWVR